MIKNLKLLRSKKGISQQFLAEVLGVSQQSINKYENHNIEPDTSTLSRLAEYFHTSIDYLVGHTEIDHVIEPVAHHDLNKLESSLIDGFRKLDPPEQESILLIIENYNKNRSG